MTKIIKSLTRASYSRGGRTGYFFGSRVGYAEGGPIYSRLGTLSSGVLSAEQQLQGINASLQKAESDLGSDSPGGGSSLAGGPSFTSNFEDANNQGPGSNLLFGGSSDGTINNTAVPKIDGMYKDSDGPLGSLYGGDSGGTIKNTMAPREPGPVSSGDGRLPPMDPNQPAFTTPLPSIGGGLGGLFGGGNAMPATPIGTPGQGSLTQNSDPVMAGFQESEFRKNANMMQQDAVNFKYNGKDMMMNGSMAGAFQQYLDSIGKGDLMQRNEFGNTAPLQSLSSFAPGVDPMGSRKENPTGPLQSLGQGLGSIL